MRVFFGMLVALGVMGAVPIGAAQSTIDMGAEAAKNPKALLAAAAAKYDFTSPALKPWHFRASYQIFDKKGNAAGAGTFEYWWESPQVDRSTWTRGGITETEWTTPQGKRFQSSGGALHQLETGLPNELLAPLVEAQNQEGDTSLERTTVSFGKVKAPCLEVTKFRRQSAMPGEPTYKENLGTYCFDPRIPVLIAKWQPTGIVESFGNFVQVQERDLARSLQESVEGRKLLAVTIDTVGGLDPAHPALTPPPDAKTPELAPVNLDQKITQGYRIKGSPPGYPAVAKMGHITGTVLLEATIGKDGKIHDLEVISTPDPLLEESAKDAVSSWEYKPYLLNGEPVEVRTMINVTYRMSR